MTDREVKNSRAKDSRVKDSHAKDRRIKEHREMYLRGTARQKKNQQEEGNVTYNDGACNNKHSPHPGGAPVLICNRWLQEELARMADPDRHYGKLYREWLARYWDLRGYHPVDSRRSFRAAVRGCLRRLRAQEK